jgi:hypothetical protein
MAPELMYPEKFGFTGKYRKRLPSRSTDTYALGMTILEVSTPASPLPCISTLSNSLGRLSPDAVHSMVSPGNLPSRSKFSKENGQTDRLQGFLTDCGSCW